jgi:hypothetical protein
MEEEEKKEEEEEEEEEVVAKEMEDTRWSARCGCTTG